jgi:hypothetical protein
MRIRHVYPAETVLVAVLLTASLGPLSAVMNFPRS